MRHITLCDRGGRRPYVKGRPRHAVITHLAGTAAGDPVLRRHNLQIHLLAAGEIEIARRIEVAARLVDSNMVVAGCDVAIKGTSRLQYSDHPLVHADIRT